MRTFATEGRKFETKPKKKKKSNSGWNEIFLKRFFFYGSNEKLTQLFKYPLTSIPLSIAHIDGTIQKTPKSSLLGNY